MILGTAGHVDHGKTTLVRALTGVDCDRLEEERRRGITISLGFAPWDLPDGRRISVVDVPGHERLVRTMLVGAGGLDAVMLVVSAEAGVMPQTREHLAACQVLGVTRGVVCVTFIDRTDGIDDALELIRADLAGTPLADAPLFPVCAPRGDGLGPLTDAVAALASSYVAPRTDVPALLPVDRVFSVAGYGTVVTGSLLRGRLSVGDLVALHPGPERVRIRGLQMHGAHVEVADPGQRVAVNLADAARADVVSGAFLAPPGSLLRTRVLDAEIEWLPHAEAPLRRLRGVSFHLAAARALADVRADTPIVPGTRGTARLHLDRPLPVPPGARFVLRGAATVAFGGIRGGGRVLDPRPPKRRRPEVRGALAANPEDIEVLVAEAGARGLSPALLSRRLPVPPRPDGPPLFSREATDAAHARLIDAVSRWHRSRPLDPGIPAAQLTDTPIGERALDDALARRSVVRRGACVALPSHTGEMDAHGEQLARKLMRAVGRAGLSAPTEKELLARFPAPDAELKAVIAHLERAGRIVRSHGMCFPGREIHELRQDAARAALAGPLDIRWLKGRAGVTRKHAIPLFNWLDASGVTARRGDVRVAGPKAREVAEKRTDRGSASPPDPVEEPSEG